MLLIYTICFLLFLPIFSTYFVVHCIIHVITFLYSPYEYKYMCTHIHPCVYVHTHLCMYIHMCVHTQTFIYGHTPVYIYTHVHAHTQTYMYVHTPVYIYTRVHTHKPVYMYTHMYTCTCVCVYNTQRHTCAYAHTERLICHCTKHIPLEWLLEKRQYAFLKLSHSVIKCTITCIMEEHIPV